MRPERGPDGAWTVAVDPAWPGFAGHFPGDPLVPAAEIIDWAMSVALAGGHPVDDLRRARFLVPMRPGDQVRLRLMASPRGAVVRVETIDAGTLIAEIAFSLPAHSP